MNRQASQKELTFWEHIGDLRVHLLWGAGFFVAFACLLFASGSWLLERILAPLHGQPLVFLSPIGPIFFQMNIAFLGALIVSLPVWLVIIAHFLKDALPKKGVTTFYIIVLVSIVLGVLSALITYHFIVPFSLMALSKFVIPGTSLMMTADSYLNFFMLCIMVSFIISELPVCIVALASLRLVNPYYIESKRRFLILGLIVGLALITPTTDVVTLLVVALPAVMLSELGILIAKIVYNKRTSVLE